MTVERFRLIAGPYKAPLFNLGDVVTDELRGDVRITAISNGRIQWPRGRRLDQKGGHAALVLFDALARAVTEESNQAVCHWWGVTPQTVSKWRKSLDVTQINDGTLSLKKQHATQDWFKDAQSKAHEKSRDENADATRRAKIAEAKRGQKRPPSIGKAVRAANLGKKHTAEARANMSKAQKKRGVIPPAAGRPWTAKEDSLVRNCSVNEVVKKTGRSKVAVYARRRKLGLTK